MAKIPRDPQILFVTLCFHAQQTAEKSIKALLVFHQIPFEKTHSIAYLVGLLPPGVPRIPELRDAGKLTMYATVLRYPGEAEVITEERYLKAVAIAEKVVSWAEEYLRRQGALTPGA